ncbi:SAM9L protein, partial [Atractosteus spatula]|nr:SAM9L protein [Atractosteus spatula]
MIRDVPTAALPTSKFRSEETQANTTEVRRDTKVDDEEPKHSSNVQPGKAENRLKGVIAHNQIETCGKHESPTTFKPAKRRHLPYPFDKSHEPYTYSQHDILPAEKGPSNLIEPVHEYKLLGNTERASEAEVLKKFSNEVFRFAAACMNSRTNGTIHFGVGDEPHFTHGEVIGISVPSPNKFVDHFNKSLKDYFTEHTNIAKNCIRQPRFVQVLSLDTTMSNRCVIEVDVVPSFSLTQEEVFNITMITCDKQGKKHKEDFLFIRDGASSKNILANKNMRELQSQLSEIKENVKFLASMRKASEMEGSKEPGQSNQGQRLKRLIGFGKDTLENSLYSTYVIVTNKCHPSELEFLQFLREMKLFAVLEFDPESALNGVCNFFRKDRIANLHYPRNYNTERVNQPKLSLQQNIEDHRRFLEEERADTFSGLLQCLNEKKGYDMQKILNSWSFIYKNSTKKSLKDTTNIILANIVLYCINRRSAPLMDYTTLTALLNEALQEEGTHSNCTELYYLAMLLLWPGSNVLPENASKNICTYVTSIRRSFHRRFAHVCHTKSAIAHFYLGKSTQLRRIVHKGKLDNSLGPEKNSKNSLWQSGAIWREKTVQNLLLRVKGTTENGDVYVHYDGNLKIPVRPVYLGGVRSGYSIEKVSFYLGFSMEGPVAYNIEYLNDS